MPKRGVAKPGLRSSIADAALAVEERLLWSRGERIRGILDAARWPFERAAWALERTVIWPLEERTGEWDGLMRTLGVFVAALVATAAGVLGLVWTAGGDGGPGHIQTAAPQPAPIARTPAQAAAAPTHVLQGAKPNFKLEAVGGNVRVAGEGEGTGSAAGDSGEPAAAASSASAKAVKPGPAATKVAHRFAGAFVLYETGKASPDVRTAFSETATPGVVRTLLRRPPRLPANVKVPRAKVLNVVPGPRQGDTYTLSVSLLRLGITSELRLHMQRDERSRKWQVTEVLG